MLRHVLHFLSLLLLDCRSGCSLGPLLQAEGPLECAGDRRQLRVLVVVLAHLHTMRRRLSSLLLLALLSALSGRDCPRVELDEHLRLHCDVRESVATIRMHQPLSAEGPLHSSLAGADAENG